ncbi:unnamed protein product [Mytilus coruscus]|uniref:Uncharacterized protein n=1 Tax=Mytilus coruscus TaxID=42192 RepID=A0A6J8BIZ9_MYTCO|nr:unnamed protein product [Mytilus coruscus]
MGDQYQRWNDLKDGLNVQTHAEVARILLDKESDMSGIEEFCSSAKKNTLEKSTSFINPFDLIIDEDDTWLMEDNSSGEELEPSFNFTLRHNNADHLPIEDSDDESDISGDDPADATETDYEMNRIKNLANIQISTLCKVCNEAVNISVDTVASATYLKWVCKSGHVANKWCSQPLPNRRMHAGDLIFASAIMLSGNNFQKVETLAKFFKLPILSSSTFHRIQKTYLVPAIDRFWIQKQDETFREFINTDVIVLGDGRMDSPGHCAQYCSYTFMEYTSNKILCITTMDKRSTDRKSTNLEKACFKKGMQFFKDKGIKVVEVVTDAHVQIASVMKKEFPDIKHSFDVWHGTKNLGKKLTKDVWYGVLHHVVNEHQWSVPFANSTVSNSCQHGPLEDGTQPEDYLKKGSPPHNALRKIETRAHQNWKTSKMLFLCMSRKGTPTVHQYTGQGTDWLPLTTMPMQNEKCEDGSLRWQRSYKKTSSWSFHPVKEDKKYSYIQDLIRQIVISRIQDDIGMSRRLELEADDPRRISAHLAPVQPPSTRDIVANQISRFEKSE